MLNAAILNTTIQNFIDKNLDTNLVNLALKKPSFPDIQTEELLSQIEAKKRCKNKLPTWFNTKAIYYPTKLNIEQTSSEITAEYKSGLISGGSLIDITGGFGVDAFYFAKKVEAVTHCEIDEPLSKLVSHNFEQLEVSNITFFSQNGIDYLKKSGQQFDWIFIDPSRRHDSKGRVFFLRDCLPNVPEHLKTLFEHSNHILIKTAPLLDLTAGLTELESVKQIHVVSVNNEVKELLWVLEKGYQNGVEVVTINLKKDDTESFSFLLEEEKYASAIYNAPQKYLYEPNASILKAGAFQLISEKYKISKLDKHTHLYTSEKLIEFPGRRFEIEKVIPYTKKDLKKAVIKKANITTRNFPESVKELRQKFKISDGGDIYLFFTTDYEGKKMIIVCRKF